MTNIYVTFLWMASYALHCWWMPSCKDYNNLLAVRCILINIRVKFYLDRLPRAVLCAGSWVRVPSPLGRAALPTTGGIGECCYSVDVQLYISMDEYTGNMGGNWPEKSTRPKIPLIIIIKFYLESKLHRPQLFKSHQFSKIAFRCHLPLCLAVFAELSPYYVTNRLLYVI